MAQFDKRMALDVIEDTLATMNTPHDLGLAKGLCGAFYMCGLLSEAEWKSFLKRIPMESFMSEAYGIGGFEMPATKGQQRISN